MTIDAHNHNATCLDFYYDSLDANPWIGFVTITGEGTRDRVVDAVKTAMTTFWKSFDEDDDDYYGDICYGDCVEEELNKLSIPYTILYKPDFDDCMYYDDSEWDAFTENLDCKTIYLGSLTRQN